METPLSPAEIDTLAHEHAGDDLQARYDLVRTWLSVEMIDRQEGFARRKLWSVGKAAPKRLPKVEPILAVGEHD